MTTLLQNYQQMNFIDIYKLDELLILNGEKLLTEVSERSRYQVVIQLDSGDEDS
jgi:hypothetical protein